MIDVLGTPVQTGSPAATAFLISDLHVPQGGGAVVAQLDRVLRAAAHARAALFVLGDLFDSYVSRAQIRTGAWRDVALRLGAAAKGGLRTVVLRGNRDFLLGPEFAQAGGVELVAGGYRAEIAGIDTLLLHGDELCQNDLPYQRAKRWLRAPAVRWLGRRLPLALALRVAERARHRSRRVIASGDQGRFLPSEQAVRAAFATGVARLVFGHVHRHARGRVGDAEYRILPAFDTGSIGVLVDADGWRPVQFAGDGALAPVAEPGPCPWSP